VRTSQKTSTFLRTEDPQIVVIDEVSGQLITIFLGALTISQVPPGQSDIQIVQGAWAAFGHGVIPWKTLVLGFLFFRLFDIWKPFPIRQLEKLPGGWGIMADDWLAGIYAAILLRVALHFNLL
jgi:phosphatidylglycerophosphatase A